MRIGVTRTTIQQTKTARGTCAPSPEEPRACLMTCCGREKKRASPDTLSGQSAVQKCLCKSCCSSPRRPGLEGHGLLEAGAELLRRVVPHKADIRPGEISLIHDSLQRSFCLRNFRELTTCNSCNMSCERDAHWAPLARVSAKPIFMSATCPRGILRDPMSIQGTVGT